MEKAQVLNTFFSSMFTKEGDDVLPNFSCGRDDVTLDKTIVTVQDMKKALLKLNSTKSPGPNELHPRILKETAEEIALPLKILFDKTLQAGKIP